MAQVVGPEFKPQSCFFFFFLKICFVAHTVLELSPPASAS
jgi:hypothetical protein